MSSTNDESPAPPERRTHIEVCARIRPLQISMQSSLSYFGADNNKEEANYVGAPTETSDPASAESKSNQPIVEDLFYAWDVIGDDTAAQSPKTNIVQGRRHQFTLDKVYGPSCTTADLYNQSVKPLVYAAMEGYHTSVMAYGQTSTGKTFSMTGTPLSPGIIPLAIQNCFQCFNKNRDYLIRISYLEIYKEQIRDLLVDGASQIGLFDHPDGLVIRGLQRKVVICPKQIFAILAQGEKRRKIGATNMNQHSSRSHVIVRLWIESRASNMSWKGSISSGMVSSESGGERAPVQVSSLSFVDLAGSESAKLHGTNEARRQEGHYINKSLMTLGKVVYALSEQGKQKDGKINTAPQHIPYRDSKLTRLLQPSLSDNARMVLICCISPLAAHVEESHNTFKFASRAKRVPQGVAIQESVDVKTLLQTYREEIEVLKQQLRDVKKEKEALLFLLQEAKEEVEPKDDDSWVFL